MEVIVLGSGSSTPQVRRASAGYLIRTDRPLLLDFGRGTLTNLLKAGGDPHGIDSLFITHLHADHFSDFIPFFFYSVWYSQKNPRQDLVIYGPPGCKKFFTKLVDLIPSFQQGKFLVEIKEVENYCFTIGETRIISRVIPHVPDLPSVGYRIEWKGRSAVYPGDSAFSADLVELCRNADLAIIEATVPREYPSAVHLTAPQACEVAEHARVKKLLLTHFDPLWEGHDLLSQCAGLFSGELLIAEDLMRVTL